MFERLVELLEKSYVPLSAYRVAAIVVTKTGEHFEGVNIENPSFKAGLCAEQVAIAKAITAGVKKGDLDSLYLLTDRQEGIGTPCFLCRQLLFETFDQKAHVFSYNKSGEVKVYTLSSLCTHPFKEDL